MEIILMSNSCRYLFMDFPQIQRPETEPTKLGVPLNGTSYKHMSDSMSSSCTLPSGRRFFL